MMAHISKATCLLAVVALLSIVLFSVPLSAAAGTTEKPCIVALAPVKPGIVATISIPSPSAISQEFVIAEPELKAVQLVFYARPREKPRYPLLA